MKKHSLAKGRMKLQRGVVLLMAMVFLLLLSFIAGAVTRTSILEFIMSGNAQFREEAFQQAQGLVAEISSDIENFPVTGKVGYRTCKNGILGCNANLPPLKSDAGSAEFSVVRRGPLFMASSIFRQVESNSSGSPNFKVAIFEVDVEVNRGDQRLGSAQIIQGIAVRIAKSIR
ncbi:MAG: hypothetical protein V7696_15735 [Halioglobus sp.]